MGITELAIQFLGGRQEELAKHVGVLQGELHDIVDLAVDTEQREEVRVRIERFPRETWREVGDAVGRRHRVRVDELARRCSLALRKLELAMDERAVEELESCSRELASLRVDVRRSIRKITTVSGLLLVLVGAGGYALRVSTRLERGLEGLSSTILWPPSAYVAEGEGDGRRLVPESSYRKRFIARFGDVYFGEEGQPPPPFGMPERFWDESSGAAQDRSSGNQEGSDAEAPVFIWKKVARNLSADDAFFASHIELEVTLEEQRHFPWDELDVTPVLEVDSEDLGGTIRNAGSRPAYEVRYKATTPDGLEFAMGSCGRLLKGENGPIRPKANSELKGGLRVVDEQGEFDWPVFHQTQMVPGSYGDPEPENYEERSVDGRELIFIDGQCYETILTATRLKDVAEVLDEKDYRLKVEFESLTGEVHSIDTNEGPLPPEVVLFVRTGSLLDEIPWEDAATSAALRDYSPSRGSWNLPWVLGALDPRMRRVQREGDKVLSYQLRVDLDSLKEGESLREAIMPDQFLAPRGVLTISCRFDRPKTGTYRVDLIVNGTLMERTRVETLVPEFLSFDPEHAPGFGIVHPQSSDPWAAKPVFTPIPQAQDPLRASPVLPINAAMPTDEER